MGQNYAPWSSFEFALHCAVKGLKHWHGHGGEAWEVGPLFLMGSVVGFTQTR